MTTPTVEPVVPSVEAIAHQVDTKLFDAMVFAFENTTSAKELSRLIPDIIAEHTGVLTEFHIEPSDDINAWVYPPDLNKNHPFIDECRKQWYTGADATKLFRTERAKVLTALIDRRNSRVSGAFTKVICPIHITRGFLFGTFPNMTYDSKPNNGDQQQPPEQPRVQYGTRFTAREVAAAILHEVGHIFSYFESLADALTTNWVLDAASQAFFGTNDATIRIKVARDVEDVLKIQLGDTNELVDKLNDKEAFHVLILSECERTSRSRMGAHIYDLRSWESASDQFASRHGASLALATALDKMYRMYGADDRHGKIVHWVLEIMKVIQVMTVVGLGVVLLATPAFAAGLIVLILVATALFTNPFDEIYDPHKFRLGRIRQDVISRLKTHRLPKAYIERTIKEFDMLERIVSDVQHHETLWQKVWVFCSSATRKQRDKMTQQQELELLANNELYVTAARLRVLI